MPVTVETRHVLVFSQPMYGHLIPLLEFCKRLADQNHHVTFVVPETRAPEITRRGFIQESYADRIDIFPLKDGHIDEDVESKVGPNQLMDHVRWLQGPIKELVSKVKTASNPGAESPLESELPVDFAIGDMFMACPAAICYDAGIPYYAFYPNPLFLFVMSGLSKDNIVIGSDEDFYYPAKDDGLPTMPPSFFEYFEVMLESVKKLDGVIVNSSAVLEGPQIMALSKIMPDFQGKPIWLVGPLLQSPKPQTAEYESINKLTKAFLDRQEPGSVAYVSFGSMQTPSPSELRAIFQALKDLDRPFLWSLRPAQIQCLPEEAQRAIETQTADSPFLVARWVDQQEVLKHPSVRVFVSHCGWNSCTETVAYGKPVVAWPLFGDQHMNAAFLTQRKLAVRIPGTAIRSIREIKPDEVAAAIRKAAGWDGESEEAFLAAEAMGENVMQALEADGESARDLKDFIGLNHQKLLLN